MDSYEDRAALLLVGAFGDRDPVEQLVGRQVEHLAILLAGLQLAVLGLGLCDARTGVREIENAGHSADKGRAAIRQRTTEIARI